MTQVTRRIQLYFPNKIMTSCKSEFKVFRKLELHTKTHLIFYGKITIVIHRLTSNHSNEFFG
jgi:hypothetical protein